MTYARKTLVSLSDTPYYHVACVWDRRLFGTTQKGGVLSEVNAEIDACPATRCADRGHPSIARERASKSVGVLDCAGCHRFTRLDPRLRVNDGKERHACHPRGGEDPILADALPARPT